MSNKTKTDILLVLTILSMIITACIFFFKQSIDISIIVFFAIITIILGMNTYISSKYNDDETDKIDNLETNSIGVNKMVKNSNTKKCKYCMSEIDKKAKICPNCRKKQSNSLIRILCIIIGIIIICVGISSLSNNVKNNNEDKCYISLEEFDKIETGMTYEEVKTIVGCEGELNSEAEVLDTKMAIYSWYGKDGISNANVTVQNDKIISKAQLGLK